MGESTNISDVSGSLLEWNAKHGLKTGISGARIYPHLAR